VIVCCVKNANAYLDIVLRVRTRYSRTSELPAKNVFFCAGAQRGKFVLDIPFHRTRLTKINPAAYR
jgi:hypothetical protein